MEIWFSPCDRICTAGRQTRYVRKHHSYLLISSCFRRENPGGLIAPTRGRLYVRYQTSFFSYRPSVLDFVLKPKHSAFYCTPLDILLNHLRAETLIIAGFAGNICVLFTANDAYMRNFKLIIPHDCIGSNTKQVRSDVYSRTLHKNHQIIFSLSLSRITTSLSTRWRNYSKPIHDRAAKSSKK